MILDFRYEDVLNNYFLLVSPFFLLIKIFGLIFVPTLQIVPDSSSLFWCWQDKKFTFIKQHGFWDFPITNIVISSPTAFAGSMPIIQTLFNFPPEHFSDLSWHMFCLPNICGIVRIRQRYSCPSSHSGTIKLVVRFPTKH